jgi:XTP/dITP diphosphohydrolase
MSRSALIDLVEVMDRLRQECPWDREQTHASLTRYLLEETYETLEAIEDGDRALLREELGDLLMQVYFHARIAEETPRAEGGFDVDDVARGIVEKLVRRHPHVFAGVEVADADEVERNWERLKAAEKQRSGVTEGIPSAMPALAYADKVISRLEKAGREVALPTGDGVGERLLALVAEARASGQDAETELRRVTRAWVDVRE